MEDTHGVSCATSLVNEKDVLILIIMEDTHGGLLQTSLGTKKQS